MKIITSILFVSILFVQVLAAQDRELPEDGFFFHPVIGKELLIVEKSNGIDDSENFQEAIDALNKKGGGVLRVENGTYYLAGVHMKTGVHIRIRPGVVFKPVEQRTDMFTTPKYYTDPEEEHVNNFSIVGEDGKFLVDMSDGYDRSWRSFVSVRSGYNFRLANFVIEDSFTPLSSLTLGPVVDSDVDLSDEEHPVFASPNSGIVENIDVINEHFGYGLIQIQAGQKILFRDLTGIGGVTLRLETGLNSLQLLDKKSPRLEDIYARNISCVDGHSAVAISPHTIRQGIVDVRGVYSYSCAYAVTIGAGFVGTRPGQQDPERGLTPGWFDPGSVVEDVIAVFGQNAMLKTQYFKNIPCELRGERKDGMGIVSWRGSSKIHIGPSAAAVAYKAVNALDHSNDRPIDFRDHTVKAYGFSDKLPRNAVVRAGEYEFQDCPDSKY